MATSSVLAFDAEGRAIDFEVWVDGLSLFDLTSGASPPPAVDADATVRSQWATRDAAARLAVRRHLPTSERAHFSQYKSAQTLYDTVVARYSSPATAALSRLMLPYLFPDLAAFPTVADLITHLRTSDTRYRAALLADFCAKNPPPMYITLYYIVTRLPDSLRVVRDHFLSVCPTTLTVDLLEKALLAIEKSIVAVGGSRVGRCGCLPLAEDAALARARGARALEERAGAVEVEVAAVGGVGVAVGVEVGVEGSVAAVEAEAAAAVAVGAEVAEEAAVEEAAEAAEAAAVAEAAEAVGVAVQLVAGLRRGVAPVVAHASSSSAVVRPCPLSSSVSGTLHASGVGVLVHAPTSYAPATVQGEQCGGAHPSQRCFGRLTDAWRRQFPEASEIPRWGELSRAGVAIYDLDFDAILSAMYAVSISDEGDCYRCFPPDPGIETAAIGTGACDATTLGASVSVSLRTGESALSGTTSALASLTFTLDSGASRSFFRDRTTLTPLSRPVAVSLADPSGGPLLSRFSTVLPCSAAPSGTLSGLYLPSFCTNLVSGADLQDAGVHQFTPARQRVTHCTEASTGRHLATVYTSAGVEPGPGPTCVPCVEGRPRDAPHSSQFPPTEAPLQTLHMDVWGPARVRGQGHERYFLLVVDDYSRYTAVFPLRSKGDVTEAESSPPAFCEPTVVHEASSQTFTLPDSPQQNGIAERRIGMVMDVARTSMMHAAAPHFLWPFAVRYAAHQINLHPRVSRPETSPALVWTGKVGDASAFRVWGSRAFVRDLSADKLSPRAAPCVFLGFPPDAPGWQFYHPTSRRVLSSQDVTFDESVSYYRLFPYRTPSLPPPPLFLVPGPPPGRPPPPSGSCPFRGAEPGSAEPGGAEPGGAEPGGAERGGTAPWGAESGGATPGGAEPGGAEPGGTESGGATPGGAEPGGAPLGGSLGASSLREPLSLQELREWFARRWRHAAGGGGSSATEGAAVAGPGGARTGSTGAAGPAGATGAGATEGVGAETSAGGPAAGTLGAAGACPQPVPSQFKMQPTSPLPAHSPYAGPTGGLAERREPASRPTSPVRPARSSGRGSRPRPPPVPGTHRMSLRPSTAPLRAPLPTPPESSLPALADPESDSLRAASPTVTRLLATVVTDPSFESTAASALVAELVDFAAHCRLDYAASLIAESESVCPPSVGDPDALDIPTPRSYAEAIEGPYSSQWQAAMDAEMASWKSTGTYVDAVPPPGANIVSGMWIFRVKRPPGSPPVFKARYVARGFSQRQGVDYFQTFSPTPKMTTLWVLLHVAAHRDYELHSLEFSTAFLQGSLHEEIWLRRPPGFTGTTLAALGFAPSTADPSLFLRTDTSLPPFYILVYVDDLVFAIADTAGLAYVKSELQKRHTCTDLEHMAAAKRVLHYLCSTSGMGLVLGGRSPVVLTGHADASWADDQATQRSSQGYTFSLGFGSVSWRATRSSSVLGSSCEAEIYAGAMAAQELRWLTYLLTDLGEPPRSPPVLYVDNKAMLALCREQRLEHRTKHIALRYFLSRELQQRG
ncbi:unnamed protein product [Closterium sp. NIES-65]|nr:unnamed protein product [Closterium sp. NIES-65]